jgi:hypothetical protein
VTGYLHPRRQRGLVNWAVTDTAVGLILILSPSLRFSSHAFDTAKSVAPMRAWGAVAALVSLFWLVVVLAGRRIPWPLVGYLIGIPAAVLAGWHAFFWMALCFSSIPQGTVGLLGCATYAGITVNHILFAVDQV